MKQDAMDCNFAWGRYFGGGRDITVRNSCNAKPYSYILFGNSNSNDKGLNGLIIFTGFQFLDVAEAEVFEIAA
jgi:hypothetical protein